MNYFYKATLTTISCAAIWTNQLMAYLPPITFESPTFNSGDPLGLNNSTGWSLLSGNASVSANGEGAGGGQALKLQANPTQEPLLVRDIDWNAAQTVAFIDLKLKPAADPEGSLASFHSNGTQLAFQVPLAANTGNIWVYNGSSGATNPAQWAKTVGTFALAANGLTASDYTRITLRHDYQRNVWDLFIGGKLAAANLAFEGRGANLENIELYGSKVGDTLIDDLTVDPTNTMFSDADKDGLPDAWETANGSNPNLYDRDNIKPGTGKSFLDHYMDSLWLGGLNGSAPLPPQGSIPPVTILGTHQPVTSLKGSMSVGGDGAMTYSMPIDIPKGTAGMEPKVSLNYSSSGGNGIAGVGWSIGGLQSVTRGAATQAKDGFAGTVNFDGEDRFFFNGERLVCVAGIYGKQNSEYRTEIDSFARITLKGGDQNQPGSWWLIETKAGLIIELGNTADSKIYAPDVNAPVVWDVCKVSDTFGNYYAINWTDTRTADHLKLDNRRLDYIAYTGTASLSPYSRLDFVYETRPDKSFAYSSQGTRMENTMRLNSIRVSTNNNTNHTYLLQYESSVQTTRSLLKAVMRQHPGGATVNPTVFTWGGLKANEAKWAKINAANSTLPRYGGTSYDANTAGINSVVTTNENSIRLDGDVARYHAVPGNINVTTGTFMEFEFRGEKLDMGAYLIADNNNTFSASGEFTIRIRPPTAPTSSVYYEFNVKREGVYTAPEGQWQKFRYSFQGDPSASFNVTNGTFSNLALINLDNNATNGAGYAEFRNIRVGTAAQLDAGNVSAITFPEVYDIPRFTLGAASRGNRLMDVNSDGLMDMVDHRISSYGGSGGILAASSRSVIGGVYENTGDGFRLNPSLSPSSDAPLSDSANHWANRHDLVAIPCDIDSDGKMDLLCTDLRQGSNATSTSIQSYHFKRFVNGSWVPHTAYNLPFESRNNSSTGSYGGQKHLVNKQLIDFDRDGYLDLLICTSNVGWLAAPNSALTLPATSKILQENASTVFLNKIHLGQGWVKNDLIAPPLALGMSDGTIIESNGNVLADVNGDGFHDILKSHMVFPTNAPYTHTLAAHRFNPAAARANQSPWASPNSNGLAADVPAFWMPSEPCPPFVSNVSPFKLPNPFALDGTASLILSPRKSSGTNLLDLNGDGLVDINRAYSRLFSSYAERSHSSWFNTGRDTSVASSRWLRDASPYGSGYTLPISLVTENISEGQIPHRYADLNGDGLVDILFSRDGTKMVGPNADRVATSTDPFGGNNNGGFINTGSGWQQDASWGLPTGIRLGKKNTQQEAAALVDVNGDGFPDVIGKILDGQQPEVWMNQCKPEVITAITDGFGSELQVQYHRINDPTPTSGFGIRVYEKFTGTLPPGHASLIDSRLVVSRYSEPNGLGGRKWKSQRYGDLRYDKTNEASLGFGWVEALDESNGQFTRTDSHRTFPFAGSPVLTQTSVNLTEADIALMPPNHPGCPAFTTGRKNLSIQTATYAEMPSQVGVGGTIRRPVQTTSVNQIFDLDGTLKGETVTTQNLTDFDAYGFVKASSVTSLDSSSVTTNNVYNHIVSSTKWHLGRLATASVTKTKPGASSSQKNSAFTYDVATGLLKSETVEPGHPLSVTKSYTHDAFGNVVSTTISGSGMTRSSSSTFDARGRFVLSETNDLGYTSTYNYDSDKALVLSTTNANNLTTSFAYDPFGTLIKTIHPDSTVTAEVTGYAANFSVPSSVWPQNSAQNIVYFRAKQSSGTPIGKVYLDALGRELVTETTILINGTAGGSARYGKVYSVTRYDSQGRKSSVSDSFAAGETPNYTTIEYDLLSRVIRTTRPGNVSDAVIEQGSCMLAGQPTTYSKTINVAGKVLERWEDQHGRLVQSKDPSGQTTVFNYDVEGQLLTVSVGGNTLLTNTFDTFGNKISVTETNSGSSSSVYNAFGEVLSSTNAKGQTTSFTYDALGRSLTIIQPEGTYTTLYSEATGVTRGKVIQITGSGAASGYQESFTYDSLGRPLTTTKTQFGETFTTSTTYDALGRVTSSTDAGGLTVMSEYDETYSFPLRQKLAPGSYEGAGATLWQAGTYDSKGRTLTQTLAQGVNISATYDPTKGDVLALSASRNGSSIQSKTYGWDSLGNLNTRTDFIAQRTETFGYDTLNRLTSSSVVALPGATITSVPPPQTYSYDIKGNLLTKGDSASLTYASLTRIHAVTSATVKGFNRTYSYDAAGYVTSDGKRTYTWTSFGQLKQLVYESAPELKDLTGFIRYAAGRVQSDFDFDAAGGRARQVKDRIAPNDSREIETTLYLGAYERENHTTRANELASPVLVKTVHRHSLGGGMIYTRTLGGSEPGTKLTNVLKDHLGSTDALIVGIWNGSTFANQSIERLSFDAWGERRDATTQISYRASDTDPFRTSAKDHNRGYTGHEQLDDSGLIHMNGRIYDPELGRFLSPDPVVQIPEYSQNFNRYSYVLNNPLNATDPSGFSFISKAFSKIGSFIKENWRTIVLTVILTAMNVPYVIALGSAGALNTALSGGSLKDVGVAFVSGFIDGFASQILGGYSQLVKTIGTGVVAGTRNYAMGGKFGDGFLNSVKFSMIFEALGSAGRLTSSYFSKENAGGIGDVSHQEHELLYNAGYDAHKMKNLGEVDPAQLNLPPGWKFKMFYRNSEESNLDYAVFINESRNIRVMSMVGTQTMGDWKDNFLQGLGLRSKQYMVAIREAFVQKNIASIDGYSFVLNGHSLGGGLAAAASAATGAPAAIFNAAGVNPMTLRYAGYAHKISDLGSNVVHYGVTGEVLSGSEMVLGFFMPRVTAKNYYTYTPRVDSLKNLSPIEWHRPYMTMRSIN